MRLGTIPFVNMAPHYHFLSARLLEEHQLTSGSPRQLGNLAKAGRLDAAPFSYVDALELVAGGEFEWLEALGVCGWGPIRSILLVGAAKPSDVRGQAIAVSPHTATTVRLMEAWLRLRHGVRDYRLVGPDDPTPLRLIIGDEALRRNLEWSGAEPQTDLSEEWTAWTGKPFVFARWAVRRALPDREKRRLAMAVRSAVDLALADLDDVARAQSERTGLPQEALGTYLLAIRYRLGPEELSGAGVFEGMLAELDAERGLSAGAAPTTA